MDPDRLGILIDRLGPGLALFARQWCESPEEVVQDAFVGLTRLGWEPDVPAAWLYHAVRNGAINAGLAERRRRQREERVGRTRAAWFRAAEAGPATQVDAEAAEAALTGLPVAQREVIIAHLWGGLTFEQIGALSSTSTSSAHRLYQAGLHTLRLHLGAPPCR